MIKRSNEAELLVLLKHFPAVCILGPRQCGKTTLARSVVSKLKKDALYLDLENPRDRNRLSDAYTFLENNANRCVVLDEVQTMPDLFTILRPLIDAKRKPGRFILLGSASPQLVKGISESLAGRISYMELTPFSLTEIGGTPMQDKHWMRGGFPKSFLARNNQLWAKWVDDFIRTYIERDLNVLFGVNFPRDTMQRFWNMLAHFSGGIWNAETFARSLGITGPTVNRYLDFLEGAFLIHRLPAYYINIKKRLVKAPKIYIRDSGILHRLLDMDNMNELLGYHNAGNSWEGYVVEQVRENKTSKQKLFFYRTHDGAECDLVIERGGRIVACVEIKLSNAPTVSKGFYQCIDELKCKNNFVVCPDADPYPLNKQVQVVGLTHFLTHILQKL